MTTLQIKWVKARTSLYHRYPHQSNPQGCFVELDCDEATLRADWNGEIGNAIPFDVWHSRSLRFGIPALRAEAANELMEEIAPLCEQIVAGYSCEWDGSNHVGRFTDEAIDARERVENIIHEHEQHWLNDGSLVQVVDADDYFATSPPLDLMTAETTDEELHAIAAQVQNESGVDIIEGLESVLESVRQELRNEMEEGKPT